MSIVVGRGLASPDAAAAMAKREQRQRIRCAGGSICAGRGETTPKSSVKQLSPSSFTTSLPSLLWYLVEYCNHSRFLQGLLTLWQSLYHSLNVYPLQQPLFASHWTCTLDSPSPQSASDLRGIRTAFLPKPASLCTLCELPATLSRIHRQSIPPCLDCPRHAQHERLRTLLGIPLLPSIFCSGMAIMARLGGGYLGSFRPKAER